MAQAKLAKVEQARGALEAGGGLNLSYARTSLRASKRRSDAQASGAGTDRGRRGKD